MNKQDGVAKMAVILTGSNCNNGKSLKELSWKYFTLLETYFLICCKPAGIYLFSLDVFSQFCFSREFAFCLLINWLCIHMHVGKRNKQAKKVD